ncbi:hypothetical protein BU24DRAFT_420856 [Aaosphaeria arxii CBS 175.79]|uniref:Uncharacterized protein n=1 Tax=Aaosphaeria arxii CBS 175.79 TaxID=1450172 RepID=A0A6A5XYL3_9PLEO|nr:uncharacterized protein BU24DRAFT_420856 [Aaosphaeria arxii CBS 175.79]KAF2017801.1 hypothetical protein BU24DRAFT_420856 [Aaosphaeria arxii CBS 175.79]
MATKPNSVPRTKDTECLNASPTAQSCHGNTHIPKSIPQGPHSLYFPIIHSTPCSYPP